MSNTIEISRELAERFQAFLDDAFDGGLEGILQEDCGNFIGELRALLAAPVVERQEPVVWTGEGLPPVGTICEYFFQPNHVLGDDIGEVIIRERQWVKAEVILHHAHNGKCYAVVHAPGHGFRGSSDTTGELFRPFACLDKVKELNQ